MSGCCGRRNGKILRIAPVDCPDFLDAALGRATCAPLLLEMTMGMILDERLWWGFAHRFRPTYAGANVGHPCGAVAPDKGLRGGPVVSHMSRKTSEMPRISCTQLWTGPRVRLSLRKGAGSSGNPRHHTGNRGCGAPGDW